MIVRIRLNVNRIEQQIFACVMSVGNERHAHPRADSLVLPSGMMRSSAGAVTEEKSNPQGEAEAGDQQESSLPGNHRFNNKTPPKQIINLG